MVFAGALLSHGELARAAKQTHSVGYAFREVLRRKPLHDHVRFLYADFQSRLVA